MRPIRLLIVVPSCLLAVFLLSFIAARRSPAQVTVTHHDGRFRALFDWRAPSTLFPPSAVISLTDDNSTFFLARPANFGPGLPASGLSGQLWIGSGFSDEELSRGRAAYAEGELGCSDVPGWTEGGGRASPARPGDSTEREGGAASTMSKHSPLRRSTINTNPKSETLSRKAMANPPSEADGTDDYLHHSLTSADSSSSIRDKSQGHADIQSLQESAEIAGKVVLLSRGGCGFLEKVKWVQRRGGSALIVGDNISGGPLVTMYARGDTSNVTIPSLFTSHTTAHLLSSLMPPGGLLENIGMGDTRRVGLVVDGKKQVQSDDDVTKPTSGEFQVERKSNKVGSKSTMSSKDSSATTQLMRRSWLAALMSSLSPTSLPREGHRQAEGGSASRTQFRELDNNHDIKSGEQKASVDHFVIGVHDWRDPDLSESTRKDDTASKKPTPEQRGKSNAAVPEGGSITPGSGEYSKAGEVTKQPTSKGPERKPPVANTVHTPQSQEGGWRGRSKSETPEKSTHKSSDASKATHGYEEGQDDQNKGDKNRQDKDHRDKGKDDKKEPEKSPKHEGLWVTLEPTTMSSSPFFDTLLVLVVSPLVTLTVVYALLLLRSRIRRRRWRAPKSVVERLPVRTYHTIASSSATTSSAQASPPGTPPLPDATTPLLHSSARPIGQRPRSRTTSEVPVASSSMTPASLSLDQIQEKREAGLLEWKRKYGGKQRECVVCLEEYVDGVSRVMSLPCGHEFHAECITPWLTTRRRTCPICKGDVVRSLARSEANTPATTTPSRRYDTYDDDDDNLLDDVQQQAVDSRNDDPAAAEPLGEPDDDFDEDLERGAIPDRTR